MRITRDLGQDDIPVAYSIIEFLREHRTQIDQPFQRYIFLWIAFNNIYTMISEIAGAKPRLLKFGDGSIKTRTYGNVKMPIVKTITEKDQLEFAHSNFSYYLKHSLITHRCTNFFVYRSPRWKNTEIRRDKCGQALNGVLNVGQTRSEHYPVWSPICTMKYVSYINGSGCDDDRNKLSHQILYILYTVRNNIFHGGKRADDANAVEVVENAIPLLALIVESIIEGRGLTTG